jgi:hypothetical protein
MLQLYKIDYELTDNAIIATRPELTVPVPYLTYMHASFEADMEYMPSYVAPDVAIMLIDTFQQLWGQMCNQSKKKLDKLYFPLKVQLKCGFITLLKSPSWAQVSFVPNKDCTL